MSPRRQDRRGQEEGTAGPRDAPVPGTRRSQGRGRDGVFCVLNRWRRSRTVAVRYSGSPPQSSSARLQGSREVRGGGVRGRRCEDGGRTPHGVVLARLSWSQSALVVPAGPGPGGGFAGPARTPLDQEQPCGLDAGSGSGWEPGPGMGLWDPLCVSGPSRSQWERLAANC